MASSRGFHVLIPNPGSLERSPFGRTIESLTWGLSQLGHQASFAFGASRPDATNIVLCPHLLATHELARLPSDTILYNLDQITPASPIPPSRLWDFRRWRVWDFSLRNQTIWNALGIQVAIVPLGWYPGLERIPENSHTVDIDILFYGAINARRGAILKRLEKLGLRLGVFDKVFGSDLDKLIARSTVVLNIHFYPSNLLETMRISYLLANGRAVISERSANTEIPEAYEKSIFWSSYENLPEASLRLIGDETLRQKQCRAGREAMRGLEIRGILERALATSPTNSRAATPALDSLLVGK